MLSHMQHEAFRLETIVWKCFFFFSQQADKRRTEAPDRPSIASQ